MYLLKEVWKYYYYAHALFPLISAGPQVSAALLGIHIEISPSL